MSFNVEARKVRDDHLPHGARVLAFAHCLERYSPLGFQVTWEFLNERHGDVRHHDSALREALDDVTACRRVRAAEHAEYASRRRQQKREGRRTPPCGSTTPMNPPRWHLAPAEGAAFTLAYYRRRREETGWATDQFGARAFGLIEEATTAQDAETRTEALLALHAWLTPRLSRESYEKDLGGYFAARRLAFLRENVRVLLGRY
jgi:hypothetical protein